MNNHFFNGPMDSIFDGLQDDYEKNIITGNDSLD